MSRKAALIGMVAGLVLISTMVFHAHADMMSYYVTFSASGFPTGAPVDPVVGSFTITFDPTQSYTEETSGITLNSLNINLGSEFGFDYAPAPTPIIIVGGIRTGVHGITPGTDDFFLPILYFPGNPEFSQGFQWFGN